MPTCKHPGDDRRQRPARPVTSWQRSSNHKEHRFRMADNHDPRCRQCRREGVKLYLKGDKCYTDVRSKRPAETARPSGGQTAGHAWRCLPSRRKSRNTAQQLREKQKLRRIYRVLENQFRNYLSRGPASSRRYRREPAAAAGNPHGQRHLPAWLRRVPRPGPADGHAPPLHGQRTPRQHSLLYSASRAMSSASTRPCRATAASKRRVSACIKRGLPVWLDFNPQALEGRVVAVPSREQIDTAMSAKQLIIEFYSR